MKAFNLLVSYLLKTHNFKIRSKSLPKKVEKSRRGRDKSKTVGVMILHNLLYMVLPTSNFIKNRILYDCFSYASSDPLLLHARNQRRMVSTNNFTFKDWIITNRFIKHHLQLTFFFYALQENTGEYQLIYFYILAHFLPNSTIPKI